MKIVELILFVAFGIAGIANQIVFWFEIEPTLKKLGYKYDALSLRRYPGGWFHTLREYKSFLVSEKRSLKLWWIYWSSFWLLIAIWLMSLVMVFSQG